MSDVSQGPGWWIASDGKWYPPELHPDYRAAAEAAESQPSEPQPSEAYRIEAPVAEMQAAEGQMNESQAQVQATHAQVQGTDEARAVAAGEGEMEHTLEAKSFFGSLFDFSFGSFVTMRVIRVLYVLVVLLYTLSAVGTIVDLLVHPDAVRVLLAVVAVPIAYVVWLTLARIFLEILMVVFSIGTDVRVLREHAEAGGITVVAPDARR